MKILILVIAVIIGLSGCNILNVSEEDKMEQKQKQEQTKISNDKYIQSALKYMQDKYGEEFYALTSERQNYATSIRNAVLISPNNGKRTPILVGQDNEAEDVFLDNYHQFRNSRYLEVFLNEITKEVFGENAICKNPSVTYSGGFSNVKIEDNDVKGIYPNRFTLAIFIQNDREQDVDQLYPYVYDLGNKIFNMIDKLELGVDVIGIRFFFMKSNEYYQVENLYDNNWEVYSSPEYAKILESGKVSQFFSCALERGEGEQPTIISKEELAERIQSGKKEIDRTPKNEN